jgi:hypothetical protein
MLLEFSNSYIKVEVDIIPGKYKNFIDFLVKHNIKSLYFKEVEATAPGYETIEEYLQQEKKPGQDIISNIMCDDFAHVKWEKKGKGINSPLTIL